MRVVDGGDDEVLEHLDLVFRHDLGVDLQRLNLLCAVDDDGDHPASGAGLDAKRLHLLLQTLLHLLRLLHHLLNVHISSTSRISAGNTSRTALTPSSASASALSAVLRSTAGADSVRPAAASFNTLWTASLRPAICSAILSSQPRFCSTMSRIVR